MPLIHVVEDDQAIRQLLEELLSEVAGWRVEGFPDAGRFLQRIAAVLPDVILLDIRLPGSMDGLAIYRHLRQHERTRETSVLFIPASPRLVEEADLPGHYSLLAKPFNMERLLLQVATMLGEPIPAP